MRSRTQASPPLSAFGSNQEANQFQNRERAGTKLEISENDGTKEETKWNDNKFEESSYDVINQFKDEDEERKRYYRRGRPPPPSRLPPNPSELIKNSLDEIERPPGLRNDDNEK
jgi:hypothetical protein